MKRILQIRRVVMGELRLPARNTVIDTILELNSGERCIT